MSEWDDAMDGWNEDEYDAPSTIAEAMQEYVWNYGAMHRDAAWIVTPYDTTEANPFYDGPRVPHPDSAEARWLDSADEWEISEKERYDALLSRSQESDELLAQMPSEDDDLPF